MKKLLLGSLCIILATTMVSAQKTDPELSYIQNAYSKEKKLIVDEYLKLSTEDREKFAQLYDEFEMERTKLANSRLAVLEEYVSKSDSLKPADADRFAKAALENSISLDKLNLKFYNKLKESIGAVNAAKYFQLEIYFQTSWRSAVQDHVPFIGELDKIQKPTTNN